MKKPKAPYASSTLKCLYSKLNLELEPLGLDVDMLDDFVQACANFYQIIEADEVWKMKDQALPKISAIKKVTRDLFDSFLSIAARDAEKGYRILLDKDLFDDGGDGRYIVYELLLIAPNPDYPDYRDFSAHPIFGEEQKRYEECRAENEENEENNEKAYTDASPEIVTYKDFYTLQEQREGKPLYVPKDILKYLDEDYYERTPQVAAVESFLRKVGVPNADVHSTMIAILADICDIKIPTQDLPETVMADIEEHGGKVKGIQQYQRYLDLMMDLSNNTRLPSNRGFTPNELRAKMGGGLPKKFSFGPGIQKSMNDGALDAEKTRSIIMTANLPDELKASMLSELDKVKKF